MIHRVENPALLAQIVEVSYAHRRASPSGTPIGHIVLGLLSWYEMFSAALDEWRLIDVKGD